MLVSQNTTREGGVTGMIGGARAATRENAAYPKARMRTARRYLESAGASGASREVSGEAADVPGVLLVLGSITVAPPWLDDPGAAIRDRPDPTPERRRGPSLR